MANDGDNDLEQVSLIQNDANEDSISSYGSEAPTKEEPYENILSLIGVGKFHIFLYIVCAMANASDAIEILCVSFVLPSAECDLDMSTADKGLLSAITFGGMMIGGYLWGTFSDIYGRKYMLILALTFNATFGVCCGLSQTLWYLLLFRFMSGIGVGGSVPVVWSYFSEFIPKNIRGRMLCALASSWFFGNLLVILIAYLILDRPDFTYILFDGFIILNNWRVFMILCSLPSFLTAFLLLFLPESPKFHLYNGLQANALRTLKLIYGINNRLNTEHQIEQKRKVFEEIDELKIKQTNANIQEVEDRLRRSSDRARNQVRGFKRLYLFFKETSAEAFQKTGEIFKAPYTVNTMLVLFIYFGLCFGYYGLWMWLPELFKRMSITGGAPCNVNGVHLNTTDNKTCHIDPSVYMSTFISAMSNLPGNIITVVWIDQVGRNKITSFSLIASGITVFGIPFVRSESQGLVLTTLFGGINVLTFNSFGCTSAEIFPTRLRATAIGVTYVAARFGAIMGNLVFGLAVDISCYIPLCTIAFLMVMSGLLSFKLPESSGIDTH